MKYYSIWPDSKAIVALPQCTRPSIAEITVRRGCTDLIWVVAQRENPWRVRFSRFTWRIIPVSKWLVTPIYKPWNGHLEGEQPYLDLEDLLTMVSNHLLNGMTLQVGSAFFWIVLWGIANFNDCYVSGGRLGWDFCIITKSLVKAGTVNKWWLDATKLTCLHNQQNWYTEIHHKEICNHKKLIGKNMAKKALWKEHFGSKFVSTHLLNIFEHTPSNLYQQTFLSGIPDS